jgi:hypothetical protein
MDALIPGEVQDRGAYHLQLIACLENETTLQVPPDVVDSYKQLKEKLTPLPLFRIPPVVQALYLEERRLVKEVRGFPLDGRLIDKQILTNRLSVVKNLIFMFMVELTPNKHLPVKIKVGQSPVSVDEHWNAYIRLE